MTVWLHEPQVTFTGELPDESRTLLVEAVRSAARRAMQALTWEALAPLAAAEWAAGISEPVDASRLGRRSGRYRVPSFDEGGGTVDVTIQPGSGSTAQQGSRPFGAESGDPDAGYLLPGDRIRLKVFESQRDSAPSDQLSLEYDVDATGVRLMLLATPVPIVGSLPQHAARDIAQAYVDGRMLRAPRVELAVTKRGTLYAGKKPPSGEVWWAGTASESVSPDEEARRRKQVQFTRFSQLVRDRDALTVRALNTYLTWVEQSYATPAFLERKPSDVWAWALDQASAPPPASSVEPFLKLLGSMSANAAVASADEQARMRKAIGYFVAWIDRHPGDTELVRRDPWAIWQQAYGQAADVEMREVFERIEKDVKKTTEERSAAEAKERARRKFSEAIDLMAKRVWTMPGYSRIEAPSAGFGFLLSPSPAERRARERIASQFLHHEMRRMTSPNFMATPVEADFLEWLKEHPQEELALWTAQAYPTSERYEIPIKIPEWQTAIEIIVSLIPVVGNIVGAGEAIVGTDLFGHELSTVDRVIVGLAVLLPVAGKIVKYGKAAAVTARIAEDYRLTAREANVLFRASAGLAPGTAGRALVETGLADIRQGKTVTDPERLKRLEKLIEELGLTDKATSKALESPAAKLLEKQGVKTGVEGLLEGGRVGATEAADLRAVIGSDATAREGLHRLVRGGHVSVVDVIMDFDVGARLPQELEGARNLFKKVARLTEEEAFGLNVVALESPDLVEAILERSLTDQKTFFKLAGDVTKQGTVVFGLQAALERAAAGDLRGPIGHLQAIKTLGKRYPAATFNLEVKVGRIRDIDIEMTFQGRRIDVEVKAWSSVGAWQDQIEKDLLAHVNDQWENVIWLVDPSLQGSLTSIEDQMVRVLRDTNRRVAPAVLAQPGMSLDKAEAILRKRFTATADKPWALIDVYQP